MNPKALPPDWSIWYRAILIWLLLITAEIVHGIARGLLLVPYVGGFRANQIGVFSGSLIILAIAYATVRWLNAASTGHLLLIGLLWLSLTLTFELLFGRLVVGLSWERLWADYNIPAGGLLPFGLLVLLLSPWLAARLRGIMPKRVELDS